MQFLNFFFFTCRISAKKLLFDPRIQKNSILNHSLDRLSSEWDTPYIEYMGRSIHSTTYIIQFILIIERLFVVLAPYVGGQVLMETRSRNSTILWIGANNQVGRPKS